LTGLLVLLVAAGVVFWVLTRPSEEERAIADIQKRGGKVIRAKKGGGQPVREIDLSFTRGTDEALEFVNKLPTVSVLDLDRSRVTNSGLRHVAGLSHLEELDLSHTRVTDAGLTHLRKLARLQLLSLAGTEISKQGIQDLQKQLPKVKIRR
jgi:hypothetical protein